MESTALIFSCLSSFSVALLFIYLYICSQNIFPFELTPVLICPFFPFLSIPLSSGCFNVALDFSAWYNLSVSHMVIRFSCLRTCLFSGIPWYYLYMYSLLRSSLFNLVSLITLSLLSLWDFSRSRLIVLFKFNEKNPFKKNGLWKPQSLWAVSEQTDFFQFDRFLHNKIMK